MLGTRLGLMQGNLIYKLFLIIEKLRRKLRQKKNRPEKPFALLYPSVEKLKTHFSINMDIEKELTAVERPIVIIPTSSKNKTPIASSVAPGLNQLGVMLPNSPLLQLLANKLIYQAC